MNTRAASSAMVTSRRCFCSSSRSGRSARAIRCADDTSLHVPEDLAGRSVHVRRHSSYWNTLQGLRDSGIDATALLIEGTTVKTILREADRLDADLTALSAFAPYDQRLNAASANKIVPNPISWPSA